MRNRLICKRGRERQRDEKIKTTENKLFKNPK
jgi:hypothetical protein